MNPSMVVTKFINTFSPRHTEAKATATPTERKMSSYNRKSGFFVPVPRNVKSIGSKDAPSVRPCPDYSYFTHRLLSEALDTLAKTGSDANKIYQDASLNLHMALEAWTGQYFQQTSFKTRREGLKTVSFSQCSEHLRDLLMNLREANPVEFWDRGQMELMLKLIVPMLFEIRSLEKTVCRSYFFFERQLNELKPVLSQYKREDFADLDKSKKLADTIVDVIPSTISFPISQGPSSSRTDFHDAAPIPNNTQEPAQHVVKRRSKICSRIRKILYCVVCAHLGKEDDDAAEQTGKLEEECHQEVPSIYQSYEFFQRGFTPRPVSPVQPPEANLSIAVLADIHADLNTRSICEDLDEMTPVMKTRLIELGVTTVDLNYVRTQASKTLREDPDVEELRYFEREKQRSLSMQCVDIGAAELSESDISDSLYCAASCYDSDLDGSLTNSSGRTEKSSNHDPNEAVHLKIRTESLSKISNRIISTELPPVTDKEVFSTETAGMNDEVFFPAEVSPVNQKATSESHLLYNRDKYCCGRPEVPIRSSSLENANVMKEFSGYALPKDRSSDRVRRWHDEQETRKNVVFFHQSHNAIKTDSVQVTNEHTATGGPHLYTMPIPAYEGLPDDPFTEFKNRAKEGRTMVEAAKQSIELLELGLNKCRFVGMLTPPSECVSVHDLIRIMVEMGGGYLDANCLNQDQFYRNQEYLVTLYFKSVLSNVEKCVDILAEFLQIIRSNILSLEEIVGEYCDIDEEEEIMQLFGGSHHHDLKPGTALGQAFGGIKLSNTKSLEGVKTFTTLKDLRDRSFPQEDPYYYDSDF